MRSIATSLDRDSGVGGLLREKNEAKTRERVTSGRKIWHVASLVACIAEEKRVQRERFCGAGMIGMGGEAGWGLGWAGLGWAAGGVIAAGDRFLSNASG